MSNEQSVQRDERTQAVENASYRWGYLFLSFALLIDVMYRGEFVHEAAWDLTAMVVAGGLVCTLYQARQKVLAHNWIVKTLLAAGVAGFIAVLITMVRVF
jgi:hypothetical protein